MPESAPPQTLYLIDAHSLIYQVFHGIRGMNSPTGVPTNALFGFVRDVLFLRSLDPTYLICCFDLNEPTFRSDFFPDYKAHRSPMPDDLIIQIPLIHEAVAALGVPVVSHPRYEADDVIATLAVAGEKLGMEVFMCTSDKDCRQLISDRVRLFNLRKREEFGRGELLADWGVRPEQVVDLQTLVGDSVDNVPGVAGIGYKTGAKLLQDFGTIENILANIDRVPGAKKQEALRNSGDLIATTRRLVKLETAVPISLDWDEYRLKPIDTEKMLAVCREQGFQSLAAQIRTLGGKSAPAAPKPTQSTLFDGPELFPFGANAPEADADTPPAPTPAVIGREGYALIDNDTAFAKLVAELKMQPRFAIDLETTSLNPLDAKIVGVALCWTPGVAHYVAVRGPAGASVVDEATVFAALGPVLADANVAKVNQNIKYDLLVLRAHGLDVRNVAGDSMVADYLLHAGQRSHGLDELARRYFNHSMIPITDLIGVKKPKKPQLTMDQVETAKVATYAAEDADVAFRLVARLEDDLPKSSPALATLYRELEMPLVEVLAEMEFNGIRLDVPLMAEVGSEMETQIAGLEADIYRVAGHEFNIGSLPQLRKVLFDELKLPVQGRTGITGEPSTDQESLEKLAALDAPGAELPRKILEHRQVTKLKGTYVDTLPTLVHPTTGRVHASFNQTVAATGRLSSSDPNLQNIPARREMGRQIRKAFLPAEGMQLLTADYSQIELRLLAHFCDDAELLRAFAEGKDIHSIVAAQIFRVDEARVTSDQRRMAKTVNFGVLYGMSGAGLAMRLQISKDDATAFIKSYFARYPKVEEYQRNLLQACRRTGMVTTILGRRRQFDPTAVRENSSFMGRNQAEREAINMEIQGSAADLIKLAMLGTYRALKSRGLRSRLLLQIHDELVFEVPPDELAQVVSILKREMIAAPAERLSLRVPLEVDMNVGPNWLDTAPLPDRIGGAT